MGLAMGSQGTVGVVALDTMGSVALGYRAQWVGGIGVLGHCGVGGFGHYGVSGIGGTGHNGVSGIGLNGGWWHWCLSAQWGWWQWVSGHYRVGGIGS